MRTSRRVFMTAFARFVLALQAMPACASGREGEALVEPIRWIVMIVLVVLVTSVFGGGCLGAFRASQAGESIPKGGMRGLLKGMIVFLGLVAASVVGLTILGGLWMAYALLNVHALRPS